VRTRTPRRARTAARVAALALAVLARSGAAAPPGIAGCPMFPPDSIWNTPVDALPVDAASAAYVATIGATRAAHADFGTVYDGAPNGIPYVVVAGTQPRVRVTFDYDDESDPGPYPIPPGAPIEGGPSASGDRHVLVVDHDACRLYELFDAAPQPDGSWHAGSGALYDLRSHALRPAGFTSADAAGLPMLPGLVRYEEVAAGEIAHALRFTAPQTRNAYVWPARHRASSLAGGQYPPMGQRFRLKASVSLASFAPRVQVILRALRTYGMILADNGSSWFVSGAPDPRWDDDELHQLGRLTGNDFEAVDVSSLMVSADSGQAQGAAPPPATDVAIEFYRAASDHYFVSSAPMEIAALDTGAHPGWQRTGQRFAVWPATQAIAPGRTPVCRYYGRPEAGLDSHFYSASPAECASVAQRFAAAWAFESANVFAVAPADAASGACTSGLVPVYRLYDARADANHRYTTSAPTAAAMRAAGWVPEGYGPDAVAFCVPP